MQKMGLNKLAIITGISLVVSLGSYSQTDSYDDLLNYRSGFAASVTGGSGGTVVTITSVGDEGFNQLESALAGDEPKWIRFSPGLTGNILINDYLGIGSNKTIDGRGADITLKGKYTDDRIYIWGDTNIIIHNIRFFEVGVGDDNGQALGLADGADLVWLDHVTFEHNGDESLSMGGYNVDYKYGYNSRLTASYCRWYNTVKCMLIGNSSIDGKGFKLTVHHSAYIGGPDVGVSRIPLLRHGKIHFYNNFVKDIGWQAAAIHEDGEALLEYNIYDTEDDDVMNTGTDQWDPEPGYICDFENDLRRGAYRKGPDSCYDCNKVFKASDYYDYDLEVSMDLVESQALMYSGRSDEPVWVTETSQKIFELAVEKSGTGIVTVFPERDLYYRNESVNLTAETGLGFEFSHWSGDISGSGNPMYVVMDTNKTVIANFKDVPVYSLTTTPMGEGRVSSKANGEYNSGTDVKIIAFPNWGYEFLYWEGDLTGSENPVTVTMGSSMNITAVFTGATGIFDGYQDYSDKFDLKCYPNPSTNHTTVRYELIEGRKVRLSVIDITGKELTVLVNYYQETGIHELIWNGTNASGGALSGGVYLIKLDVGNKRPLYYKMILNR